MKNDFVLALTQLASENGLPLTAVFSALEEAIKTVYAKEVGGDPSVDITVNNNTGEVLVHSTRTVVERVVSETHEISLEEAQKYVVSPKIGSQISVDKFPYIPSRIAAQSLRQLVIQKLRSAKSQMAFEEYSHRTGQLLLAKIIRVTPHYVAVQIGEYEAILPSSDQLPRERYVQNSVVKVILKDVRRERDGNVSLIVSRTEDNLVLRIFEREVPEISSAQVSIVKIAREPGFRSKIAVMSTVASVDAVGSCVGSRGLRINKIVDELNGESVDVIPWSEDPAEFIREAISPATPRLVDLNEGEGKAYIVVDHNQLSISIGRKGQNVRLAAKVTGWDLHVLTVENYQRIQEEQRLKRESTELLDALIGQSEEVLEDTVSDQETAAQRPHALDDADVEPPIPQELEPLEIEAMEPLLDDTDDEGIGEEYEQSLADEEPTESGMELEPAPEPRSISQIEENVWQIRRARPRSDVSQHANRIRFAEDIEELREIPGRRFQRPRRKRKRR